MSEAHLVNSVTSKTRFGGGNRTTVKIIARGDVDIAADLSEINAGQATELPNGDIRTTAGRIYGRHPGGDSVFLRSGSVGTVDLTQAELRVLQEMIDSGGLSGNARTMFDGMRKAYNSGLSADSEQKLLDLYSSRRPP